MGTALKGVESGEVDARGGGVVGQWKESPRRGVSR